RDGDPHEHGRHRLFHLPADSVQAVNQCVATAAIHHDIVADAVLGPVQRDDGRDLDRLKNSIVEIALDLLQCAYQFCIADAKTDPPTRHVVTLRQSEELHADILSPGGLKKD